MPGSPEPEPYHEPIGFSDEQFRLSRRWILLVPFILAALAAGILVLVLVRP